MKKMLILSALFVFVAACPLLGMQQQGKKRKFEDPGLSQERARLQQEVQKHIDSLLGSGNFSDVDAQMLPILKRQCKDLEMYTQYINLLQAHALTFAGGRRASEMVPSDPDQVFSQ